MSKPLLSPDEIDQLLTLGDMYHAQAGICHQHKAYLASCISAGSGLEAVLLLMIGTHSKDARAGGKELNKSKLLKLNLGQLIDIAVKAGWLSDTPESADLRYVRKVRNYVHPGRHLNELGAKEITQANLVHCFNACCRAYGYLLEKYSPELS
jgi:hypothetical protein